MPFRTIADTGTRYALLSYGADGKERHDDPDGIDGLMSRRLLELVANEPVTNIFLFSHGWMGDVPAAIEQYDKWIRAFDTLDADKRRAQTAFPGFHPLFIGLHWPSLPWGDEEVGDGSFAGAVSMSVAELEAQYLERLGDTEEVRAALSVIMQEARFNAAAEELPPKAREAFLKLDAALELGSEGPGGPPDADRAPFDPETAFQSSEGSFGIGSKVFEGVLGLLRMFSYWSMKKRARIIGEGGMHSFVKDLQRATAGKGTRFHLMGHSFGCIVTSSILGGPNGRGPLERPIDSVMLAQGAFSFWSYSPEIPLKNAGPGYFHRILADGKIRGPLVTTQSKFDTAVGVLYPMASGVSGEASFAAGQLPKFGAVGTHGLQGLAETLKTDAVLLPADGDYAFAAGRIYNLESSKYVCKGGGGSGAHNDICGPEVAHAIWEAALASARAQSATA